MKIGPKYKIARRLNAPIFEKTQTQKYALSAARKTKTRTFKRSVTDFGLAMAEKQKARFTYAVLERQFAKYVGKAVKKKGTESAEMLYQQLESRLDNVVYRIGLAPTRLAARQVVSHGHITVNGKKVNIPSYQVSVGDVITIRTGSVNKKHLINLAEKLKTLKAPSWIAFDAEKKEGKIISMPKREGENLLFNLNTILEFYTR